MSRTKVTNNFLETLCFCEQTLAKKPPAKPAPPKHSQARPAFALSPGLQHPPRSVSGGQQTEKYSQKEKTCYVYWKIFKGEICRTFAIVNSVKKLLILGPQGEKGRAEGVWTRHFQSTATAFRTIVTDFDLKVSNFKYIPDTAICSMVERMRTCRGEMLSVCECIFCNEQNYNSEKHISNMFFFLLFDRIVTSTTFARNYRI